SCPLTQPTIIQGLSLLCRTGNGLKHAFVRLDLKDRRLNDITALKHYIHIRFLDLSKNHLTDLSPLASLTQLLWLKVDKNDVTRLQGQTFAQLTYLQWLSMADNQLTDVDGLVGPALESLNLSGNNIQKLSGLQSGRFTNLVTLELRGTFLESTLGINLPNLQRLYLAQNVIKHLEGLEKLEHLTTLHLRDNQLDRLDGLSPKMMCLKYLNVRGNGILNEEGLQALKVVSKTLRVLILSENPLVEMSDYRMHALVLIPDLERIDKDPVLSEEKAEAWERIKEEQEDEIPKQ
ncbi:unnamed protein product, partial [Lampetra planeri]